MTDTHTPSGTDSGTGTGAGAPVDARAALRRTAADWYQGTRPAMLVYAGVGTVVAGLDGEIWDCLDLLAGDERGGDDPAVVAEHERLVVLWHGIEPAAALLRAGEIGRRHAETAVARWANQTLGGGRGTAATTWAARWALHGITDGGDREVLADLASPADGYTITALGYECGWQRPVIGDEPSDERWRSVWGRLWDVYETELWDAVRAGAIRACQHALDEPNASPPEVDAGSDLPAGMEPDGQALARACHAGAWAALAEATAPRMAPAEAWAVIAGRSHPFVPPIRLRASAVQAAVMTSGSSVPVAHGDDPGEAGPVHPLVAEAWQTGCDAVWPAALSAAAMARVGTHEPAEFLARVVEDRLRKFAEAIGDRPRPASARPHIRPIRSGRSPAAAWDPVPEGWVTQPIGRWYGPSGGVLSEVVYDPRRHDITVTTLGNLHGERLLKDGGWERYAADGLHVLWVHDRFDVARAAIDRVDQRSAGVSPAGPTRAAPAPQGPEL